MSHAATVWAISQRGLPASAKVVLWHLADRYNPDYGCFPKQAPLAVDCELSKSSLNTQLDLLEGAGLIRRERRVDPVTKQQMPTRYRFAFEEGFQAVRGAESRGVQCNTDADSGPEAAEKPSPESGLGSGGPSPENGKSRVQLFGLGDKAEPVREPVRERECAGADGRTGGSADAVEAVAAQQGAEPEPEPATAPSLEALRSGYPRAGYEPQGPLADAWNGLTDAQQRAALEGLAGYLAGARDGGRKFLPKAADYLKNRLWTIPEARAAAQRSATPKAADAAGGHWSCAAWSRDWWALLLARIAAGRPCSMLVEQARQGKGWGCPEAERPDAAAVAALMQHRGDSGHFEAWRRWLARRGAHIDRKPATTWVWLPADAPPAADPG